MLIEKIWSNIHVKYNTKIAGTGKLETTPNEPRHEISKNVVCATSKGSDQSDQSLCWLLEHSMNFNLLTEHHLEFLSFTEGCKDSSESILVKMQHCWKSRHGSNVLILTIVVVCH